MRTRFGLMTATIVALSPPAYGWGRIGHQAVAIEAERLLTPEARKTILDLLASEGSYHLSDISSWADEVRPEHRPNAPAHSVRIPMDVDSFDMQRDCTKRRCAVRAIDEYLATLSKRNAPPQDRLEALKYIVHLVGDIHQPLHAASRTGREIVVFHGKQVTLHKLWDTSIVGRADPQRWVAAVRPIQNCGTPAEWAEESHRIAIDFIYAEGRGTEGEIITKEYANEARRIILNRITLAGQRLACVLQRSFGSHQ
jgi:hypothetical protein